MALESVGSLLSGGVGVGVGVVPSLPVAANAVAVPVGVGEELPLDDGEPTGVSVAATLVEV